jgi:hypothetical protein
MAMTEAETQEKTRDRNDKVKRMGAKAEICIKGSQQQQGIPSLGSSH